MNRIIISFILCASALCSQDGTVIENNRYPCFSIENAQSLLPAEVWTEEGTGMLEYNGVSVLYNGGSRTEEIDDVDFQDDPSSGIKLSKNGTIIIFITAPEGAEKIKASIKSKLTVSKELKWTLNNISHSVYIIGNNKEFIKRICQSLGPPVD